MAIQLFLEVGARSVSAMVIPTTVTESLEIAYCVGDIQLAHVVNAVRQVCNHFLCGFIR